MRNTIKALLISAVLMLGCCLSVGQTTGSAIPDATAERLYFLNLSNQTVAARTDYLGSMVGLASTDLTSALSDVSTFQTSYSQAASVYNNAVSSNGFTTGQLQLFQNQQASITAIAMSYATAHLSAAGLFMLQADIQAAKNGMEIPNATVSGMSCCYSTVKSVTVKVIKQSPLHATVTYNRTLEGNVPTIQNPTIRHQGKISLQIGTHSNTVTGMLVTPNTYINLTATLTLDTGLDLCLSDGDGCADTSTGTVFCSMAPPPGIVYASSAPSAQVEIAFTQGIYVGPTINCHSGASGVTWCQYRVGNFCTMATTPPDLNLDFQNINDIRLHNGWDAWGLCVGVAGGPWVCSYGAAIGIDGSLAEVPCTKN